MFAAGQLIVSAATDVDRVAHKKGTLIMVDVHTMNDRVSVSGRYSVL